MPGTLWTRARRLWMRPLGRVAIITVAALAVSAVPWALRGAHGASLHRAALIGVIAVMSIVGFLPMVLLQRRGARNVAPQLEAMKQEAWTATVTRRERHDQGGTGWLVVYYRRDHDGGEGSVLQYVGNAMDWTFTGALEFYREAPRYEDLDAWREGDRLKKWPGEYFPHNITRTTAAARPIPMQTGEG